MGESDKIRVYLRHNTNEILQIRSISVHYDHENKPYLTLNPMMDFREFVLNNI